MTFRIDNIKRSAGHVWISIKARNSQGWSEYITLISGTNGGLHYADFGEKPDEWEVFLTPEEFPINEAESSRELAIRFAKVMISRSYGPMVDMENDAVARTVEDIDRVKFEECGHVGRYR